ncbi:MAG TPA: UrcA family protein [Caulobacteraceae bacterium]
MTLNTMTLARRALCGVAAGAFSLGLAALPVHAQDRDYNNGYNLGGYYYDDTVAGVTVRPYRHERSAIGAPIDTITASRVVSYRDLDLSNAYDAHILKVRIERAARSACDELDNRPDVLDSGSPDCYRDAVSDGFAQVADNTGYEIAGW